MQSDKNRRDGSHSIMSVPVIKYSQHWNNIRINMLSPLQESSDYPHQLPIMEASILNFRSKECQHSIPVSEFSKIRAVNLSHGRPFVKRRNHMLNGIIRFSFYE